ncbi:unnamed protein product [Prunus armeniaca]
MTKVTNFSSVPTRNYIFLAYRICHITLCASPRNHCKGLMGMIKGEGPRLAKSWSSVNHVCLPFNLQRQKHWILLVVELKECEIRAYDSKVDMCRTQAIQRAVQPVAKMLPQLLKESGYIGNGLLLKTEWPIIHVMDAPQQVGG